MPRKPKAASTQTECEDFIVVSAQAPPGAEETKEYSVEQETQRLLEQAMKSYDMLQKQSSAFLTEKGSYTAPTSDELAQLSECPQDDINKILRINSIIGKYSNLDDVLGTVTEAIRINLNTDYRLSYKNVEGRNKSKKADKARDIINSFNKEISIKRQIRELIPRAYMEGTVITYLRRSENSWTLDLFPLGVALISPYNVNGDPVVLVDVNELKSRLIKTGLRTRNGKNMFFDSIEQEVRENFCDEIYQAYLKKEQYAKLDIRYTGVLRIGNCGRKYGVSPALKSLSTSLILETFQKSDMLNAKARAKKVFYQLLDPILLGTDGNKNPIPQQRLAHKEFIDAYKQTPCLYSASAYVKSIGVLEPKGEMVGKDVILYYLQKQMSSLGIGFTALDSNSSISSAKISLAQLMRNINSIGESLEEVLEKFYRQILIDEGIPPDYAPSIKIIDSEALEPELKIKLASILYATLNTSLKTTYEVLGLDFEEELMRRREENSNGVDKEFYARESLYTKSGDSPEQDKNGRPKGEENDKQDYDENYNQDARPEK